AARGSSAGRTTPWPQCRPYQDGRPFPEAPSSCSTRTARLLDGSRPCQTTSRASRLLMSQWSNSTGAHRISEATRFSISPASAGTSETSKKGEGASKQLAHFSQPETRASSLHASNPQDRDEAGDTFCATLWDLDKERDDVGVALQMLTTAADSLIGPTIQLLRSYIPSPSRKARRTQRVTQEYQRVTVGSTRWARAIVMAGSPGMIRTNYRIQPAESILLCMSSNSSGPWLSRQDVVDSDLAALPAVDHHGDLLTG